MRIISGTSRGRRLFTPGRGTGISVIRPTADRVREAVFNILGNRVVDAATLDLFAGTGALGLEALSRGSGKVVFVDANNHAIRLIKRNIDICGFSSRAHVVRHDLLKSFSFLKKIMPVGGFDLVFIDPPYRLGIALKTLKCLGELALLGKDGLIIVEEAAGVELPAELAVLRKIDSRIYGETSICFYRNTTGEKQHE